MGELAELAAIMMTTARMRIDSTARNIGNLNTPGFRAHRLFQRVVDARQAMPNVAIGISRPVDPLALRETGNPLDLAVTGDAVLLLREGDAMHRVRSVQLRRDAEGKLVDAVGRVLQADGGGDIVIGIGKPTILSDGTVLLADQPAGRVGMFGGDRGAAAGETRSAVMHQGMVVPSDVDLAEEMIELISAARSAEAGARLFELYDDLLGKTATQMGGVGR